jgi:predicted nucleic acid-binding protein
VNVFFDTNVLLDVLANREPFYADSAKAWTLAEMEQLTGSISTLTLPNLYYLLRRTNGSYAARKTLGSLRSIFRLVPLDAQIINQAIDADIKDFEDALQFFSAIRVRAAVLLTRNPKDFPTGGIVVQTPAEFLATHFSA